MPHALYMDVHIPKAITDGIQRCGIDVISAQADGAAIITDEELLERAAIQSRLLFTQDNDFLEIGSRWQSEGKSFPGIIYGHQLRCSIGRTIEDLELICTCAHAEELASQVIHLPLA